MHRNTTKTALKALGLGMALLMIATPAMAGATMVQGDRDHLSAPGVETDTFVRHPDADVFRVSDYSAAVDPNYEVCFLDKHGFELSCFNTAGGGTYIPQGTKAFAVTLTAGLDVDYYLLQASLN